jgi:hypothetical protein
MEEKLMAKNKSTHIVITFVTMFAVQGALVATPKQVVADYTRPLSFEANRGQTDKKVDFLAHGAGYGLFLSHAEAVMVFQHGTAVRMRPIGANASSQPEPLDPQASKSNYFIGNVPERWHTNVPNYAKVRYRSVYPGIDLIYYGNQQQLEYDFVLGPGADPRTIALLFDAPAKPQLEHSGDLVMHTAAGDVRWHKPLAYQEVNGSRKLVACDYVRKGRQVAFRLGAYDRSQPLIIDPELVYSTYLGGSGNENFFSAPTSGIALDASGNAYVAGSTSSSDFPIKSAFQTTLKAVPPSYNAFVAKFNPTGELVYSTYLGGSGHSGCTTSTCLGDEGNGIAVDEDGDAYITGDTASADFPTENAFQSVNNACSSFGCGQVAFVAKLNGTGSALVFSTYLGGSGGGDVALGIAVDMQGHAYVAGYTHSQNFPVKNALQPTFGGSYDAFVTKFDLSGSGLIYSTFLGGSGSDVGMGIAVDTRGDAYITGVTASTNFPIENAFQQQFNSSSSSMAFVTKLDANGDSLVYSTYLGGSNYDQAFGIAVDASHHAYVTGVTRSGDFPTKNAFQKTPAGGFITKFDPAGTALAYSTYFPADPVAIAVDADQNAYITGSAGPGLPINHAFQRKLKGFADAFVTKIDPAGCALVYSSYLGGSGNQFFGDIGFHIAVDESGNAVVTGLAGSMDFPTTNAVQPVYGGGFSDAFVTKISAR